MNTNTLISNSKKILEQPFWIPTLEVDVFYTRTHDDHDGSWTGKITVVLDRMGDAFVWTDSAMKQTLRFRTYGGGGRSLRVRNALMLLVEAIRLDNEEKPE